MSSVSLPGSASHVRHAAVRGLPVVAAIGVFGVIYGATATPVVGAGLAVASSVLMFTGAGQFAMVALVDADATQAAIVVGIVLLGLRHAPLAAMVRPRLGAGRARRALLGLGLLDETAGLAVADDTPAETVLGVVGAMAYVAFLAGTVAGVLGADVAGIASLASIVFLLLFIGLASLTCRDRGDVGRAAVAAAGTVLLGLNAPGVGALGAMFVAIAVAASSRRGARP